jgi:hypothetical protein
LGHQINTCSKPENYPGKNLLVEEEPMNFTNNEGDSDKEGGVLHGDDIITLVIRKSLLIPKGDSDKD